MHCWTGRHLKIFDYKGCSAPLRDETCISQHAFLMPCENGWRTEEKNPSKLNYNLLVLVLSSSITVAYMDGHFLPTDCAVQELNPSWEGTSKLTVNDSVICFKNRSYLSMDWLPVGHISSEVRKICWALNHIKNMLKAAASCSTYLCKFRFAVVALCL